MGGAAGAVVMTVLLRRVSGVALLEKSLVKRRPGYAEYVARTSPFIPRPPRRAAQGDPNGSAGTVLKAGNEGRDPCVAPPDTRTSQGD